MLDRIIPIKLPEKADFWIDGDCPLLKVTADFPWLYYLRNNEEEPYLYVSKEPFLLPFFSDPNHDEAVRKLDEKMKPIAEYKGMDHFIAILESPKGEYGVFAAMIRKDHTFAQYAYGACRFMSLPTTTPSPKAVSYIPF